MQPLKKSLVGLVVGLLVVCGDFSSARGAVTLTTLISFGTTNGADPSAELLQAPDGSFYGTTQIGSSNNLGTVFKITSTGTFSNLLTFTGTGGAYPGANPAAGLVWGSNGTLFGTTEAGGANGDGTVFALTTNGVFTNLVSFTGTNGAYPGASPMSTLVWGTNGNLYGTTAYGGTNDYGSVFELAANGVFTSLISFTGTNVAPIGASPYAGLLLGKDGNFYGATAFGGTNDLSNGGDGTIFRMTPSGTLSTLVSFNTTNGAVPQAVLVQGTDGNYYGTTFYGGSQGAGTIFKMTSGGALTTLFSFSNTNGANPNAGLVQGLDGNFYGTTQLGDSNNDGTIFQITPAGLLTSLVSFGGTNGAYPVAELTPGTDGNFYGTAASGTIAQGTVFRFPPPPVILKWWQTNSVMMFTWTAATGQVYQVQFTTNLNPAAWNNLGATVIGTNALTTGSDTNQPGPRRIYRVGLLP
ncbi:MAG: choice-of-anchor tandem repeat GloVer-containing protein [Verrucomicrobiia bacterium]